MIFGFIKYWIMIRLDVKLISISLGVIIVLFFTSNFSFYEIFGDETVSTVTVSESTFKIVKDIPSYDIPEFNFRVINHGPTDITIEKIIPTNLNQDKNSFSLSDTSIKNTEISFNDLPSSSQFDYQIPVGDFKDISMKTGQDINFFEETTLSGKVKFVGNGFETITKDISITYVVSPLLTVFLVICGIAVSMGVGYLFYRKEIEEKITKKVNNDNEIINHINEHINEINEYQPKIDSNIWTKIKKLFNDKKVQLETNYKSKDLKIKSEEIQWFESFYVDIQKTYLNHEEVVNTEKNNLDPIDKFTGAEKRNKVNNEIKNFWKNNKNRKKGTYIIIVSFISSLSGIFTTETFVGNLWLNILLALATGFVIYRAQDFPKLFKQE